MSITGTIIGGTYAPQDLIPAFLDALAIVDPVAHSQYYLTPFGPIPAHAMDDDGTDWWYSEDAEWMIQDLMEALENAAPEGHYFGALEGDGCHYGFWPIEEEARSGF